METSKSSATNAYPHLLSSYTLGGVELRNRLVFQPHFTALGTLDGMPSDDHRAYFEERARGGVGLIIIESQAVHPTGKMSRRFINAWDPAIVPGLRTIADAVHEHGTSIFGQLTHAGHTSLEDPPHILWAPTQMPEPSSHHTTKAMDEDDITAVIEGFAKSARNVIDGGFDGVEIKVAHDGLLRSFASPFFNHRKDRYGGNFENRMRLTVEVLEAMRAEIGPDIPIGVRMCVNEFTPFGYDSEYGLKIAAALEATGHVTYFNADAGSFSSYWMEIPPAAVKAADFRRINVELKGASKLPVIGFGRISPQSGEALIRDGEADLVGMARQLIADPETPNKLMQGRGDLVRMCIACNDGCIYQVQQEKGIRCIHNPGAGREATMSERLVTVSQTPKRVLIAGGGPAGLKAAEIAARRGHNVTLFERQKRLGGLVNLAAVQPEHDSIGEVTAYLEAMVSELGVTVHLGKQATKENILAERPDVVIVATGSEPNLPNLDECESILSMAEGRQVLPEIEGLDSPHVLSVDQVLSRKAIPSGHVVVIDNNGHWEAAGTAEFLADAGCRVTVLASHMLVGENIEGGAMTLFHRRAAIKNITLKTSVSVTGIEPGIVSFTPVFSGADAIGWGQYILMPGEEEQMSEVDWVVPAIGRRSREDLYLSLRRDEKFGSIRIERIGDCAVPRLIQSTIGEAFELARDL